MGNSFGEKNLDFHKIHANNSTLKVPITTAADDILIFFLFFCENKA